MTLVKDSKKDFIQEGLLQWRFCSRAERSGITLKTRTMGIYSQEKGWIENY